jgi:hypothetical protein
MEENAYITSIIAGSFYLIAGLRLLRLHRRTRERPELLFALYFGFSGAYYLSYNLPNFVGLDPWSPAAEWIIECIYVLGVFPYLFFLRTVFRPDAVWAGVLVGFCSVLLLAGTALGALDGAATYSFDNPWFLIQWVGYTVPCAWMCWEALIFQRGANKRTRIGLCPPTVANRYLLMALFGGFQVVACLADLSIAEEISEACWPLLMSEA